MVDKCGHCGRAWDRPTIAMRDLDQARVLSRRAGWLLVTAIGFTGLVVAGWVALLTYQPWTDGGGFGGALLGLIVLGLAAVVALIVGTMFRFFTTDELRRAEYRYQDAILDESQG